MVNSVTFPAGLGGNGLTYTDDSDPNTGLDNYGYTLRFVPMLSQAVIMANTASTKAAAAAASATSALNAPGTNATSTTSLAIATGSKTFTIQTGKAYAVGQTLVAASAANPANFMTGQVTAHDSSTGTLTLNVAQVGGSGTKTDWVISMGVIVSSSLPAYVNGQFLTNNGSAPLWAAALIPSNNLSDVSSASTARTNLGLGSLATLSSINNANWSGTALAVANGGTGSTTAAGARTALGVAASGANSDITSLSGLSTALSIAQGGSGATTAAGARTNFGLGTVAVQDASNVTITGGSITGITDLAVADGGTGSSTAAGARSNLGAAASGANADITSLSNLTTPLSVAQGGTGSTGGVLGIAHFQNIQASGSGAGETIPVTTWTQRILNTTQVNTISGCSLSSNQVTLPAGTYEVWATCTHGSTSASMTGMSRLRNVTDSTTIDVSCITSPGNGNNYHNHQIACAFTLGGSKVLELDTYSSVQSNGGPALTSGENNCFVSLYIRRIA